MQSNPLQILHHSEPAHVMQITVPFLFLPGVHKLTSDLGVLPPQLVFFVPQHRYPGVFLEHLNEVNPYVNQTTAAGDVALVVLDGLIWLPVSEAHEIVKHEHDHNFVEKLHVVGSQNLVGPRLPCHDGRNYDLEHQAHNLEK